MRLDYRKTFPAALQAMLGLEDAVHESTLEPELLELLKMRASLRAALAWCEALTLLPQTGAPDEVYAQVREQFEEEEIVALTLAVVAINGWNRFAVGFRSPVGRYVSPHHSMGRVGSRGLGGG